MLLMHINIKEMKAFVCVQFIQTEGYEQLEKGAVATTMKLV
jgi:hypothetical protein